MAHKLSKRAVTLLALVNAYTVWEGDERPGKVMQRFWVPQSRPQWLESANTYVDVTGGGDARALRSLAGKGLIRHERATEYSFSITEDGIKALAEAL